MTMQSPDDAPESSALMLSAEPVLTLDEDDVLPSTNPLLHTVDVKIRRQDDPFAKPYWQQFRLPYTERDTVLTLLHTLRLNPVTVEPHTVDPVAFEHSCMETVCGSCAMLINNKPRMACATLVNTLGKTVTLEPLPKFPVVRDLIVDRSRMFAHLRRAKAWITLDGSWDDHQLGLRIAPQQWARDYQYSRCMYCGCCMAACPQYDENQEFVGPATLAQVRLLNAHPLGQYQRTERLHSIMGVGGLDDCGHAQNCVRVCPNEIPLTTAIGELGRAVTWQLFHDMLGD